MRKILTLCLVVKGGKVLLGMKKRGFGEGWWNGFGGKVLEGESIEEGAKRELLEEAGLQAVTMEERGVLEFIFSDKPIHEVHVFEVSEFSGEPLESEEMKPQWFAFSDIPYSNMWPDDKIWLPLFLERKEFSGSCSFDEQNNIISHTLGNAIAHAPSVTE